MVLIEKKIDTLGSNPNAQKITNQTEVLPPPPNPKPIENKTIQFRDNSDNIRRDLMNELKDMIKKKNQKKNNN